MAGSGGGSGAATSPVGALLRQWRSLRGRSQLDLALDAGVSQRHVSFVESGRSNPSRTLLLQLSEALSVPLRERNALLIAAGYAPCYAEVGLDAPQMGTINKALQRMLRQHEPFPAVVMDRYWNVLFANDAAPSFFNCFVDMAARRGRRNLLHLMFDPEGMRPFVANWHEAARGLLARVYREAVRGVIDEKTMTLLEELSRYEGVKPEWRAPTPEDAMPMVPLTFSKGEVTLRYFSLVTTVGTPQTVAAEELRLECMFPADEDTEAAHAAFISANAPPPAASYGVARDLASME